MSRLSLKNDPAHWRRRAKEARRVAEQLEDAAAEETMREIARSYDHLAGIAETHESRADGATVPRAQK